LGDRGGNGDESDDDDNSGGGGGGGASIDLQYTANMLAGTRRA